jgi:hypothetical protein
MISNKTFTLTNSIIFYKFKYVSVGEVDGGGRAHAARVVEVVVSRNLFFGLIFQRERNSFPLRLIYITRSRALFSNRRKLSPQKCETLP